MYKIIMPQGGQTTDESVICKWHKQTGDKIEPGDVLFDIETDKTVLEVESYCKGYLRTIKYGEGETVPVGETVAYIGEIDEPVPDNDVKDAEITFDVFDVKETNIIKPAIKTEDTDRILASPLAKKIAREHSVDLKDITPANNINVIKKQDVLDYMSNMSAKKPESVNYIPYYTVSIDADMTECIMFKKRLNDYIGPGKEITVDDMIKKCVSAAIKKFPLIDSIAIKNLGIFGVDSFTSVIKQSESCVIAIGAIKEKAVSVNREIVSRDMMNITASFDHRVTEDINGAQFLSEIKKLLESPELLILMMAL